MKTMLALATAVITLICSPLAVSARASAEPNSKQYVTIFNLLSDANREDNQSDFDVSYLDRNNVPVQCWTQSIPFNTEPYSAGAGGRNGCKYQDQQGGIYQIKINPKPIAGTSNVLYQPIDYTIDTNQYLTLLVITQKTPPTFDPKTGKVVQQGTINVLSFVAQPPASSHPK